ncbi:MAG: glycosyltransferase family 39 protein [Syntrophaceae bacterium]|nr:glycosyltransferase family 39 protein [Syntrophaceae bacterium]
MKKTRKNKDPKAAAKGKKADPPFSPAPARVNASLVIFILALTVRLVYLYESSDNPAFFAPIIDANYYDRSANDLIRKGVFSDQFFFQGFFYPLFLAGVYALTGSSMVWAKVFQALLGAAACALTCLLGEKAFSRKVGVIAGAFASLYAPLFFFGGELLPAVWGVFWSVWLLFILMVAVEKKSIALCLVLGSSMPLSVLSVPTFLPFCGLAAVWLAWKWAAENLGWSKIAGRLAVAALAFAVAAFPVGFMSMKEKGTFAILPTSGAVNLYIGNNPDTDRTIAIRPGIRYDAMRNLAFKEGVVARTEEERNRYLIGKVISYALSEPVSFMKGMGFKILQFLCSRELTNNEDIYLFRDWSVLLSLLSWKVGGFGFPFGVLLPLAVAGIVLCRKQIPLPLLLFPAAYAFSVVLVHVNNRYRLPAVPVLCILAAAGLVHLIAAFQRKNGGLLTKSIGGMAAALFVAVLPGPLSRRRLISGPRPII